MQAFFSLFFHFVSFLAAATYEDVGLAEMSARTPEGLAKRHSPRSYYGSHDCGRQEQPPSISAYRSFAVAGGHWRIDVVWIDTQSLGDSPKPANGGASDRVGLAPAAAALAGGTNGAAVSDGDSADPAAAHGLGTIGAEHFDGDLRGVDAGFAGGIGALAAT
jgi:hypothetical protein